MEKYKIAIELIELLIKNHDAVDSVVEESKLILHIEKKIAYCTNTDELSECVKLINSIANKKIIKEGWISKGGFLSSGRESSYLTEFQVPTLTKILELLKVVENDEIVDSEFDEIILFQQRWNS